MEDINCVWIGEELSIMERLSLILAKKAGYNVILWSNSNFENIPDGIVLKQLPNDILSPVKFNGNPHPFLKNGGIGSLSQWSDYFAYEILYKNGGYWMQLDLAILNKLNISNSYAFTGWSNAISPVFMKIPKGSEYAKETIYAIKEILKTEMKGLPWEHSMRLMHNIALKHKIYDDCKIINHEDGYFDCGSSGNNPYDSPMKQPLSFIHWSNATNYSSKKTPILNSEYYNLCKINNLI
jgi:hypothetical protein